MPKILTQQQIDEYWRDGCLYPVRVMSAEAAAELRARLEAFEKSTGGPMKGDIRHKSHLLFSWLGDLVRQERIVDAIEDLYGPNLFCWTTNFFIKEANNPAFVSWHQDSTYWGLDKPDVVTAWVALTPSNRANGAMGFIPGTHTSDQIPHRDTFGDYTTTVAAFVLFAVPVVWAATMALVFICGGDFLFLFPPGGLTSIDYGREWPLWERVKDQTWHLFLPVVLLSYAGFAGLSRYMRSSMLEVLRQDYVQVARAKGLSEGIVVFKHAVRNSLIPQVTILAELLPGLIGGSVIIETVF